MNSAQHSAHYILKNSLGTIMNNNSVILNKQMI